MPKIVKYVSQKQFGICGAVALLNAIIWAQGPKPGIKRVDKFCRGKNKDDGTNGNKISKFLDKQHTFIRYKLQKRPKLEAIKKHLSGGGAVLLQFVWSDSLSGHYCLITEEAGFGFVVVNWDEKQTTKLVSEGDLQKVLGVHLYGAPRSWFLWRNIWQPSN